MVLDAKLIFYSVETVVVVEPYPQVNSFIWHVFL